MQFFKKLKLDLENFSDQKQAEILSRFFKTGIGEYGQGDKFLGVRVSILRKIAKHYGNVPLSELQQLLNSKIHENRQIALFILMNQYGESEEKSKKQIVDFYLRNTKNINNWDLVDISAPNILGNYFLDKKRNILFEMSQSKSLWERRIAVLATLTFIRNHDFKDTLKICKILINDQHDLIHKACGWMLREIGNRSKKVEQDFLRKNYQKMPRTMLRYAIEKFPEKERKLWLNKKY